MTDRFASTALFLLMCSIWGATWIAVKVGVAVVPPVFFAGSRFVVAGLLLLSAARLSRRVAHIESRHWGRLLLVALLMVTGTYALLFWGAKHVSTGLAAVIDLAALPVALLVFGIIAGQERLNRARLAALALGAMGLGLLFARTATMSGSSIEAWAAGAIFLSAILYAAGSVLARPLLSAHAPLIVSAWTLLAGGATLTGGALLFEPGAREAASLNWGWQPWTAWIFLVLGGSVAAFTIYLRLVRDWGPSRAGAYCYVSPILALALGATLMEERLGLTEFLGSAAMLLAAWLALRDGEAGPADGGEQATRSAKGD